MQRLTKTWGGTPDFTLASYLSYVIAQRNLDIHVVASGQWINVYSHVNKQMLTLATFINDDELKVEFKKDFYRTSENIFPANWEERIYMASEVVDYDELLDEVEKNLHVCEELEQELIKVKKMNKIKNIGSEEFEDDNEIKW